MRCPETPSANRREETIVERPKGTCSVIDSPPLVQDALNFGEVVGLTASTPHAFTLDLVFLVIPFEARS